MRDFDYGSTVDFLAKFYEGTDHAVEIRVFPNSKGDKGGGSVFTRDPQTVQDQCTKWARPGFGTFFGVATRRRGSPTGQRKDLVELPAVWAEVDTEKLGLDKADVTRAVLGLPCPPSLVIDSGRGLHFYWMLHEAIDISIDVAGWEETEATIVAVLKQLAGIMAGDTNVCDLARVMRLPGTTNTKDGQQRLSVVVEASWARYELSDLIEMLDTQRPVVRRPVTPETADPIETNPFLEAARRFSFNAPIDVEHRLAAMRYEADGDGGVHATQLSVSASLVVQGMGDSDIAEILMNATMAAAGLAGAGWNWRREEQGIVRMIASARAKFGDAAKERQARGPATIHQLRGGGAKAAEATEENAGGVSADPESSLSKAGYVRNDIGNAMHMLAMHPGAMCYVVGLGWHVWDGKRYRIDPEMLAAHRLAHNVSATQLKIASGVADKDARKAETKWAISTGTNARIAAMLHQARSYVAYESDDLDANIWLLNCQNGTLDLRTMGLRPHTPSDLCTKVSGTIYDAAAICPRWESFLDEIFDGDAEMVRFVQCALGYSLTGSNKENVFFILHGTGKNGKSKLLETVAHVMGDYMMSTPADTWSAKPAGSPSNDIAALPGSRLVTTNETEKNHSLREGLVKQVTGGDKVNARKMFQEFFEFTPQCKLWIATNNKPRVSGSDGAIWDRVRLLPFNVKFVPADELTEGEKIRDNDLMEKLIAELPGILAWMVRGCAEWQRSGLRPAVAMMEATGLYRAGQDSVQGFLNECTDLSRGLTCAVKDLFSAYELWCSENDEEPLAKRSFGKNLDERGYPAGKNDRVRVRKRIDLKGEWREKVAAARETDGGTYGT